MKEENKRQFTQFKFIRGGKIIWDIALLPKQENTTVIELIDYLDSLGLRLTLEIKE